MKTWEDVERAALNDPYLRVAVMEVRLGHATREEALIAVTLALAEVRQIQHEQLVEFVAVYGVTR